MRRPSATTAYYALEFLRSMPAFVVIAVYLVREVGLDPLQLILVGTVMEAAVFVFEIPTGVFADTFGRKRSIVVSLLLQGAAWSLVGLVPHFIPILVAWALWGFGWTFMSGAYEAWITDEVGSENVGPVFARGERWSYVGALVGLGAGVGIAAYDLSLSVVIAGATTVAVGLVVLVAMPETGYRRRGPEEERPRVRDLVATASNGVRFARHSPLILLLLGTTLFAGAASEAFDRLREAHFIREVGLPEIWSLDPVVWFGLLGAASMVVGLVATSLLVRHFERATAGGLARVLFLFTAVGMVGFIAFGLAGSLALAVAASLTVSLSRSLTGPLYMTWLNQQITDSSVRATVISISGQADAIGQTAGGPALGVVGNVFGLRAALVVAGLVIAPVLGLYGRAMRHGGREPELEELPAPTS
jgi:DHA3 family tetracycline resistance protein-like MFS transporter